MWRLDAQAARPWACERCGKHPRPHPIDEADPDAERDELGLYVPGWRAAPTAMGELEDERMRACPEAELAGWVADLLQLWRLGDGELAAVVPLLGGPPAAVLLDAWDVLTVEVQRLRAVLRKRKEG